MINQTSPNLDSWHRKQAAMLLHFTSLDYIKGLQKLVNEMINGVVDPILELADFQNRDAVLIDPVWRTRNSSENWENNAWPILKDLQAALVKDVELRSRGRFERTAVNECLRGIDQYSLEWTSPEERRILELAMRIISSKAGNLDDTLSASNDNRWTDYDFAYFYPSFAAQHTRIPKIRVRVDIVGETGSPPPRTGVYVSKDDPHAAVQFAWTGANGPTLTNSKTFNDVGLAALNFVGREELWFNARKMFDFATSKQFAPLFHDWMTVDDVLQPDLASSGVAMNAFREQPCTWYLLEVVDGEYEEIRSLPEMKEGEALWHRLVRGETCAVSGYYFTPSMTNSRRYLKQGEITPKFEAQYGQTIWQWDMNQE